MWQKSSPTLTEYERSLIQIQEYRSVNFVNFILENANPPTSWFPNGMLLKNNENKGLFVGIKGKSLVLPFFMSSPNDSSLIGLKDLMLPNLALFFSVLGPKTWTDALKSTIPFGAYKTVHYDLMTLDHCPSPIPENIEWEIIPVGWENADLVFPLQEGYEKEEVLFSPQEFQKTASSIAFQKTLKTQKVLALFSKGKPVAKAHTNAKGWEWNQLGGIYTIPEYRGMGLGSLIVRAICLWSFQNSRKVSLFVKKNNTRAINLYKGIGFKTIEDFEILYYQKSST